MLKTILIIVAVLIVAALGFTAYSFLRTPEEASGPIEAIPLSLEQDIQTELDSQPASEMEPAATAANQDSERRVAADTVTEADALVQADDAAAEPETVVVEGDELAASENEEEASPDSSPTIYEILPAESEARFQIGEILRGSPFTVVGTTDQVAGEFAVDARDLSSAQIGPILVNARTLATDNDFRNRALKNQILTTDVHEFITFTPSEIIGLAGTGTAGDVYNFQIVGDLTIRDVTRPVTFETTATAVTEDQLTGTATATVLYADFDLFIPNSQAVASVEDEVVLAIDFVAAAKDPSAES
ncbi:MAG: YceI family protein [Anaerolineae bacterium]|jgi:polyisoprenoid-binding protein YceI|nr:YceI family protein [Anaerolineae bacterium]